MASSKPSAPKKQTHRKKNGTPAYDRDVLTLAEAAGYLRVKADDLEQLATRNQVPARKIGSEWRFLRTAVATWLAPPTQHDRLMAHAGAARDDPYFDEMLQSIYERRGRPMVDPGK